MRGRTKRDSGRVKHEVLSSFEDWRAKSREETLRRSEGRWERVGDDGGREQPTI
jgi:hypothetical protein